MKHPHEWFLFLCQRQNPVDKTCDDNIYVGRNEKTKRKKDNNNKSQNYRENSVEFTLLVKEFFPFVYFHCTKIKSVYCYNSSRSIYYFFISLFDDNYSYE